MKQIKFYGKFTETKKKRYFFSCPSENGSVVTNDIGPTFKEVFNQANLCQIKMMPKNQLDRLFTSSNSFIHQNIYDYYVFQSFTAMYTLLFRVGTFRCFFFSLSFVMQHFHRRLYCLILVLIIVSSHTIDVIISCFFFFFYTFCFM